MDARDDSTDTYWACLEIYDDRVYVLAIITATERIDRAMTHAEARKVWADLLRRGWHHAATEEIDQSRITRARLLDAAYRRRRL
jgi:hypothetical protein